MAKAEISDPHDVVMSLLEAPEAPAALLIGSSDLIRRTRIATAILKKFAEQSVGIRRFRSNELDASDLVRIADDSATLSLFAGARFFVFEAIDDLSAERSRELATIIQSNPPATTFLLLGERLPVAHPIHKVCSKVGKVVTLEKLEGPTLKKWIGAECKRNGITSPAPEVVEGLRTIGEENPDKIAALTAQLALFVEGPSATGADLAQLFPESYDPNEFELVDALLAPNPSRREILFQQLCARGKSPFMLLGMLARALCIYCAIAALLDQGQSPDSIQKRLNMSPWAFKKNVVGARRWNQTTHIRHLRAVLRADSKLKNKSLGAEAIFSELFAAIR